ncbi:DNA mismatch repair endonuclease MutL [uncultured Desulfuromonas sp.]|uniref:DNA mismatch repair endonuclease MutL n=1 Tax=uncultured Desulfuromonas sp. TaxID=181013 RepID=UPI002632B766|nr:DNA mismatch repair endonuclease MutL [uncultured Desulfuromonas sp.]
MDKHKISILPETLCNQIAAGEVVERPASVVKELVENSLDAGSKDIRIEVEKGGKRLLRVTDDGEGMGKDDAFLCLERHATSKITSSEDLFQLRTLGFRGEALPSIASVSRFTLRTRSAEAQEGWEIYAEGGIVRRAEAAGLPGGTVMEVRDLFFNTPARRKFLRREETELGHIGDVVTKLALAHPEVQFRLVHNGRAILEAYRQGSLEERVGALLGRPLLKDLLAIEMDDGDGLKLTGLVSQPAVTRSTTGYIYTFINGRYVRDRVVQHAVLGGYRHLLMKGRYPVAVLFLEIDPEMVDVNVHPTKHEVRFREQGRVHDFLASSVRQTLSPSEWLSHADEAPTPETISAASIREGGSAGAVPDRPAQSPVAAPQVALTGVREALTSYAGGAPAVPGSSSAPPRRFENAPEPLMIATGGFFSSLELIGQYRSSYILCQDGEDLILVDQHAAHERIGFERLCAQFRQGTVECQALLFPTVIEVDFREAALLKEQLGELERLGFELEPFGGKSFALKAVPRLLRDAEAEQLVLDVAAEIASVGKSGLAEEALDKVLMLMACHGVIRANQGLAPAEMLALLRDLDGVDFKAHCPHGRPVMSRLAGVEVERMFKRT